METSVLYSPLWAEPFSNHEPLRLTERIRPSNVETISSGKAIKILIKDNQENDNTGHDALMQRIAHAHDKAAFATLFSYYAPRVKSYLVKMGLNRIMAEDTAQDVMVTLWEKAGQFDPQKAKLSTWLFRIARNKFIDHTRKRKFPEVNADDFLHEMAAPDQTDQKALANQDSVAVARAMERLGPDQRKVVELAFFQNLTNSEASEVLSIPLGTVKSRLRLAFKKLRNELRDIR